MTDLSCGLRDDIRLGQIGIDSLGLILIFVDLSTQTGLLFERQEDIFTDLDQAMTQFDIKSAMNHVNRLLQMIVAQRDSLDVQRSRQLLSLAALLGPFAPELVGNLGFSQAANAKRVPTAV
jgi:hypothetical protein